MIHLLVGINDGFSGDLIKFVQQLKEGRCKSQLFAFGVDRYLLDAFIGGFGDLQLIGKGDPLQKSRQ